MTCICKLKVDRLKEALEHLKNNVAGLPSLLPNLSVLASLAENAAISPTAVVPVVTLAPTANATANLSASQAATVAAAAQLAETASLQATLQAQLGVNLTSPTAPCALGGIIESAQVSGLISVLEFISTYNALNPLGALASAITSISDKLGIDLLEDKPANYMANNMDMLAQGLKKPQKGDKDGKDSDKPNTPEPPELPDTDLSDKPDDELPGMVGDAVRKLGEYLGENPNANINGLANDNLLSLFNTLVTDLDETELQDLIQKAIEKTKRDFAAPKNRSADKKEITDGDINNAPETEDKSGEDETAETDEGSTEIEKKEIEAIITENETKGTENLKDADDEDVEIPSVNALIEKMVHHDMSGRADWDPKKAAEETLKKAEELEDETALTTEQDTSGLIERLIQKLRGPSSNHENVEFENSIIESDTDSVEQLIQKLKDQAETEEDANSIDQLVQTIQESPESAEEDDGSTEELIQKVKEKFKTKSADSPGEQIVEKIEPEDSATEGSTAENGPKTPANELSDLIQKLRKKVRAIIVNSVKASNAAANASNTSGQMTQMAFANPAISPDAMNLLKDQVTTVSNAAAKGSNAMTDSLKALNEAMAHAAIGDLDAVKAKEKEIDENVVEAEAACNQARGTFKEVADTANAIKAAEQEAHKKRGSQEDYESEDESQRVVANAINSAVDSARKTFGGDISSVSGLAVSAQAIAAININGPALAFVSSMVSEEMLIQAMAKLNIIFLLGDVFGANLFNSGAGASIAASLSLVASASASASASAGGSAGLGASGGAGVSAGASAGAGVGAGAGVSASASATAGLNSLSGLLAGTPPSPTALLLLIGILAQLAALGHNVVAFSKCSLALEAMKKKDKAGDANEGVGDGQDKEDTGNEDAADEKNKNTGDGNREDADKTDDTTVDDDKNISKLSSESDSNTSENDPAENDDGQDNQDSNASDDATVSSAVSALTGIKQEASWFQSARRKPPKIESGGLTGVSAAGAENASMELAGSADSDASKSVGDSASGSDGDGTSSKASDSASDNAGDSTSDNTEEGGLIAQNEADSSAPAIDGSAGSDSSEASEKASDDDNSDQFESDSQKRKGTMAAGMGIGAIAGLGAAASGIKQSGDEDSEASDDDEDPKKASEGSDSEYTEKSGRALDVGGALVGGIGIGGFAASQSEKTEKDEDTSWVHRARRQNPELDPESDTGQETADLKTPLDLDESITLESDSDEEEPAEDDTWVHRAKRHNPEADSEEFADSEDADLKASLEKAAESESDPEQSKLREDDTWFHRARRHDPITNPEEADDTSTSDTKSKNR